MKTSCDSDLWGLTKIYAGMTASQMCLLRKMRRLKIDVLSKDGDVLFVKGSFTILQRVQYL